MRVYELAKEFSMKSTDLVNKIRTEWSIPVRSYMEYLSPDVEKKIRRQLESAQKKAAVKKPAVKKVIRRKSASASKKSAASEELKESSPVRVVKKNVIRRKAVDVKPLTASQPEPEKKKEEPAPSSSAAKKTESSLKEDLEVLNLEAEKKIQEEKRKLKKASDKEEEVKKFRASDFRKREVIFQPKKKRSTQNILTKKTQITKPKEHKRVVKFYRDLSVQEFSHQMGVKAVKLLDKLKQEGMAAELNTLLDFDVMSLMAVEFGFEIKDQRKTFEEAVEELKFGDLKAPLKPCPPVVTVMGHVDHGKTTLLDFLRKTRIVTREAGGITQHIGAYSLPVGKSFVTFIDTPGHAAFADMRARGAQVTNIAVIVVAADDGVNSQTIEAVQHAQSAKVPILVAVNKIDKPEAQPEKIKQQMSEQGLVPEEWGGDVIFVPLSALKGTGVKELLEQILLLAEMQEIKANPKQSAQGVVIESRMEKGRGWVASLIVQNGTLKKSQYIMTPSLVGRVRQMTNDQGQSVDKAPPGLPVEISGFDSAPQVGDPFFAVKDEKRARDFIEQKTIKPVQDKALDPKALEQILTLQTQKTKELNLILRADAAGSLEAVKNSIQKINSENVKLKIIHSGLGGITENDILLSAGSHGEVFGFNVRPDSKTEKLAKEHKVPIWTYNVIYELLESVKKRAIGKLDPHIEEEVTGKAEVREVFHISKLGSIAGAMVVSGKIGSQHLARVIREGRVVYNGRINSLRRFKEDVKEAAESFECGIGLNQFNDVKQGDFIESYIKKETARTEL